jgi:nicotinate phosphoribosyltransferase
VTGSREKRELLEGFLFTDQYQLTMAQLYWRHGMAGRLAQFDYFFRRYPDYGRHRAGYAVFAGLGWLLDWMAGTRITEIEVDYLRHQEASSGSPLFDDAFLRWLTTNGNFDGVSLRAVPEGRVVHAGAPIVVAAGPLAATQILETSLLNRLNYQTLVATKASRIADSARGSPILEFGLRRAPDVGGNPGSRAALIGGADFTSNVGLSSSLGLDPMGTHAHSMVQLFMALGRGELEAFRAYADVYPDDCTLLVDTIDTLGSGIPNAIAVFEELRRRGHEAVGIRLDSGDLAYLAVQAARMLEEAGFGRVHIVLSSDLDELAMAQILEQIDEDAPRCGVDPVALIDRLVFGVGTRLVSSHGHPALDGVYKLVAVEGDDGWLPAIKISDSREKMPIPGNKRVWRVLDARGLATADVVSAADEDLTMADALTLHHPQRDAVSRVLEPEDVGGLEELVVAVVENGRRLGDQEPLEELRRRRAQDLDRLDPRVRRLVDPHRYHVSLTGSVKKLQTRLVAEATDT